MPSRIAQAAAWTALILVACLVPGRWLPAEETRAVGSWFPHSDKVVHAALFAGFGVLWSRAIRVRAGTAAILVSGVLLAVFTELAQASPAIARDPDALDGLADVLGLVVGLGAVRLLGRGVEASRGLGGPSS